MPDAWNSKHERQYIRIRASQLERGRKESRAEEIAAWNRRRREDDRTPDQTTQAIGNPYQALEERTSAEIYDRARELSIAGRSRMNKEELVRAIRERD